eukprot:TRINITY_DN49081_c0_g1_i1.p1 TRINITY_DN49081_c0_g1~~TRINITY_DN49081_c0_g1_i1.p1  ORF type:complete len:516 (-),score=89.08 TRINITY_DN49081_c0_g1_i1:147-1694(-)
MPVQWARSMTPFTRALRVPGDSALLRCSVVAISSSSSSSMGCFRCGDRTYCATSGSLDVRHSTTVPSAVRASHQQRSVPTNRPLQPLGGVFRGSCARVGAGSLTSASSLGIFSRTDSCTSGGSVASAFGQQRRGLNRACGLVGYPNVGKSTLFNAFVGSTVAAAENFPFCTIEPNVVKIGVPDPRLAALAKVCGAGKIVPGMVELRDIAGLIKGASSGAGMGNEFLSHIRGVQVILHVVRCFSDPDVIHVVDPVNIDPVEEFESILAELVIADLEYASNRLPALRKRATTSADAAKMLPLYESVLKVLEEARPARSALASTAAASTAGTEVPDPFLTQLITAKPVVVLANVAAEDASKGNDYTRRLEEHVRASGAPASVVVVSAPLEAEVAQLEDAEFKLEYLESYGLREDESALPRILNECQKLLKLVSFLTVGEVEARAWFVPCGSRSHEAAGAIHSDFVKNFEQAEVWSLDDVLRLGGKGAVRHAGLVRMKGKDYEVKDGDVLEFRVRNARS